MGWQDWLMYGSLALNLYAWWLNYQGQREWEELRTQYERYVRNLEALVAQYEGRDR